MACNGHTNSCPAHGGYLPGITPTNWSDDPLDDTITIKAIHHNELRSAIDSELTRRSQSWPSDPGNVTTDDTILSTHVRSLRDGINAARAWSWPSILDNANTEVGDSIQEDQYNALRDEVNVQEAECACDCNYACTCDCNYCTCNCNYGCTCNCAYSDKRLKKDIVYM